MNDDTRNHTNIKVFNNIYANKKVLVTGHTGFKGSWLVSWLLKCDADVFGYSLNIPTKPSMFESLNLESKIHHKFGDVRNKEEFSTYVQKVKPDFIFHLAAQAIVSESYVSPFDTISTNVMGTASVLDALRNIDWKCTVVMITSDKAYDNVEWIWGYRENDRMGGKDVYSGSKGAAELVIKSYWHSFIKNMPNISLGVARAGNVIGGGDWSKDRIVVDCIKAFCSGGKLELRSPSATRPWQHVLEPLSGYLSLAQALAESKVESGSAFNFGPRTEQNKTVLQLVEDIAILMGVDKESSIKIGNVPFEEARLLKLNCDKALAYLGWHSTFDYNETVDMIVLWYKAFYENMDLYDLTLQQIQTYETKASERNLSWTKF